MENRCVCCGEIIPEGRMVCPNCENERRNKPMDNWISVSERLPKTFARVLLCRTTPSGEVTVEQGFRDVGGTYRVYGTRCKRVTHWMPMPLPPGGVSREG